MTTPVLVWLRRDLRLADHPALTFAAGKGPVVAIHVDDPNERWGPGGASRWWLHHTLADLSGRLDGALVVRRGDPVLQILSAARECGAALVVWNRHDEPHEQRMETILADALRQEGIASEACASDTLFPPGNILGKQGQPLQVFTAFWRATLAKGPPPSPLPPPRLTRPAFVPASTADHPLPRPRWWGGLEDTWEPGETGAQRRLSAFLEDEVQTYATLRDRPDRDGTSRLSPHLAFGELSPRQVWHAVAARPQSPGPEALLRQLVWRDFSRHLLARVPSLPDQPLNPTFAAFPWRDDPRAFEAWSRGRTGIPIVDAGMRQLWHTGWMHNRVRMIVASVLVKGLLIPWQRGQEWFWDTLVDADLANNAASWQWVAGCGADAAPYFRIFNPTLQGEKFDPDGGYVRRWVPELARTPPRFIHKPWEAGGPAPIIDHKATRDRALAAFRSL
jgi:deoxyribodipyrimidine photo-lyase